jgi:hypothetical protein
MNITTENFQDYGIIDWFDQSKGFGVVKSVRSGEVFIHKKHGISGEAEEKKVALIGNVCIDTYKKIEFTEIILKYWMKMKIFIMQFTISL